MKRIISLILAAAFITPAALAESIESRGYLYAGSTSIYTHNVDRTGGGINLVCPDYYEINGAGSLKLTRIVDQGFIKSMKDRGVKVLPFVSNHWDRDAARAALSRYEAFADQIVAQVVNNDLDGIDIDIENIDHTDRSTFTQFIKTLREKLPSGKLLSVCVAANPWGGTTGWQGAYDYAALGNYCNIIFIMTYDESYQGGSAGPVASYDFIRKSLDFALKHVKSSKVMMGLPFYGRYWVKGAQSGGNAFTLSDIGHITDAYNSVTWYDGVNECARAQVTVTQADLDAGLWGNKKLSAGVYDIWYESPRSLERKLGLVQNKSIRGAGAWALGYEPDSIWTDYPSWIYPLPFVDIKGHWAQTTILSILEKGLMVGSNKKFRPDDSITRAEAAIIMCRLTNTAPYTMPSGFADTAGHYADGYIAALKHAGVAEGVGGNRFEPNRAISRQEMCVLINRILHVSDAIDYNEQIFPDVGRELTPWSNNAIITLFLNGIINGMPDGTFKPEALCTRAEAAAITLRTSAKTVKLPGNTETVIEPR